RQSKTIFAGGKGFALPRLFVSAAQEGAGGMRGGFLAWRSCIKSKTNVW
ncbi:MAG: hypothetical protein HY981_00615, partial [Candidatus Magasanikbacteria bacterium]|nr:hypothetical protein [Candidatus Magasanikbacteria bacterium]